MSAQVIYLNRFYYPNEEERQRLDAHQEFLHFCHIEFEQQYRYLLPIELKRKKEEIYTRARQAIGIVRNE
jgi:hypothetical protein